jgi:hypothetical protein
MKHLKIYENFTEDELLEAWEKVQQHFDVYQLYELLLFKYGSIFTDTKQAFDEEEVDDNIYEIISWELKSKDFWNDFLQNYLEYENEMEEADPFHWKNNVKAMNKLSQNWDKLL